MFRKSAPDLHKHGDNGFAVDAAAIPASATPAATPATGRKRPSCLSQLGLKRRPANLPYHHRSAPASPQEYPTTNEDRLVAIGNEEVNFRVDRLLGNGAYGKCYMATPLTGQFKQITGGQQVAIKIVEAGACTATIEQEIKVHTHLNHKNIVRLYSHFYDSLGNTCLLLELCNRQSVAELVAARGPLVGPQAVRLLRGLVKGTAYLHSRWRIVHRDIKPSNLLLTSSLRLKMSDFGLACSSKQCWDERERVCGTPNYLAPEIFLKQGHSFQSDLWAIGISLFFLYAGRPPFASPPPPSTSSSTPGSHHCPDGVVRGIYRSVLAGQYEFPPSVEMPVRRLVTRILQRDPSKRASTEEILSGELCTGYCPCKKPFCTCSVRSLGQSLVQFVSKQSPTATSTLLSAASRRTSCPSNNNNNHTDSLASPPIGLVAQISPDPVLDLVDLLGSRARLPRGQEAVIWITRWSLTSAGVLYYTLNDGSAGAADRHSQGLLVEASGRMTEIRRGCCQYSICSLDSLNAQCQFIRAHLLPFEPQSAPLARLNALCFPGIANDSNLASPTTPQQFWSPLETPMVELPPQPGGPIFLRRWSSANTATAGESLLFLFSNGFLQVNLPGHMKLIIYQRTVLCSTTSSSTSSAVAGITSELIDMTEWLAKHQEHYAAMMILLFNIL